MHPNSEAAFEQDAERATQAEVAELKKKLAALEGNPEALDGEIITPEDTQTTDDAVEAANVATVAGEEWRFHTPKPQALMAFGLGTVNRKNNELVMRTMSRFLGFYLVEEDYERLLDRMMDTSDSFGDEEFGELFNKIIEAGANSAEAQAPKTGPAIGR